MRLCVAFLLSVFFLGSRSVAEDPMPALSPTAVPLPTTSPHTLTRTFLTTKTTTATRPPEAVVTEAPVFDGDVNAQLQEVQEKWHLTTYWSCVTFGSGNVDCGWHEPVLPGGDEIAGADGRPRAKDSMPVAAAIGALAVGLLLR